MYRAVQMGCAITIVAELNVMKAISDHAQLQLTEFIKSIKFPSLQSQSNYS